MESLDSEARENIRAVVVDANIFDRGLPNLTVLERVASRLANKDIKTLVPEPVAWEWAEHLATETEAYRINARAVRKRLSQATLAPGDFSLPYSNRQEVVDAFLAALEDLEGVTLLPLSGKSAHQGIRDQILQTGSGTRKSGVKTGASDSAWFRDALAFVGGKPEALIVLTSNRRDIVELCKSLRVSTPIMYGSTGQLPDAIFTFITAPEAVTALVTKYVLARMPLSYNEHTHEGPSEGRIDFGALSPVPGEFDDRGQEVFVSDIELQHVTDLIAVSDINIEEGDEEDIYRTASATAWFLADVDASVYTLNNDGQVVMDSWQFNQSLVVAPLFIEFERDEIVRVVGADETRVHLNDDVNEYAEGIDGLADFRHAFELIEGLKFPDTWPEGDSLDVTAIVNGQKLDLYFSGDPWSEWSIEANLSGSSSTVVACSYDGTAVARIDGENVHMRPPYALYSSIDGVQLPGVYPAVAHIVRELYGGTALASGSDYR